MATKKESQPTVRIRCVGFTDREIHDVRRDLGVTFGKIRLVRGSKSDSMAEFSISTAMFTNPGGIHGSLAAFQAFSFVVEEILRRQVCHGSSAGKYLDVYMPDGVRVAGRIAVRRLGR